jgi:1-aminocyclopropane-1-carboxylate synthase
LKIPIISTNGGIFIFADFRSCLSSQNFVSEEEFRVFLLKSVGISTTPGSACHLNIPGFFRICYAFVNLETLELAMNRLKQHIPLLQAKYKSR